MDCNEEDDETSDLEALEFALYSQIHYESHSEICNIKDPENIQISDSSSAKDINRHYDIGVQYMNSSGSSKTGRHDIHRPTKVTQKCASGKTPLKSGSSRASKDSALGSESFLDVTLTENSVIINSDSDSADSETEERSKIIEVLSKSRHSKSASAKKSVIEIESNSEDSIILLSDVDSVEVVDSDVDVCYDSVNSDDMLLDEDLSDVEGLHVNVDKEYQSMLSTTYDFGEEFKPIS
jgi:hypothetical protein